MAYSYIEYTAAGSSTFNIPFDYINQSEIEVFVDGTAATFTFTSANTVNVSPTPTNGATVRVERNTDLTNRAVDFASGSVLTEEDMDNSNIQVYHAAQEAIDKAESALSLDADGKFDGEVNGTKRVIKNVANPTNAQDVATKDYLENTWLTPSDKTQLNALNTTNLNTVAGSVGNVNTVASNISDVNTVASNTTDVDTVAADITKVNTVAGSISNVNTVSGSITNVNTTAGSIGNVNTVATNISDVTTVANDLNEPVSEIETVATDITNVNTVGTNISNVNAVAGNSTNINAVAGNATNINAVNANSANINAVNGNKTNIDAVAGNASNINAVNANSTNINTVAGNNANVSTVAGISGNVTTVAGISSDVTAVANISQDIQDVQDKLTEVQAVANDLNEVTSEIDTVAASIANVDAVGTNITNVNTVASNITDVNSFADTYSIGSTAPTSPTSGDLWFDTSTGVNTMKVYNGTSWQNAGSSVNGTSARFKYTATANQTTFSGADANGDTLAYDSGYIDVFLNGIHLDPSDYTATNGTSIVLGSGAALNDELYVVAFGTFTLADHYSKTASDARYLQPTGDGSQLTGINTDLVSDTTPQLGGNLDTNGNNINFGDNVKAQFGASNDLQIYHDGSNSVVRDAGTGNLKLQAGNFEVTNGDASQNIMTGTVGGAVRIYHNNSEKLATTAAGVNVTGSVTATGAYYGTTATGAGTPTYSFGGDSDTGLYHATTNTLGVTTGGTERMRIDSSGRVTMPYQPAVDVKLNGNNSTNGYIFTTNAVQTDVGSNWNSSTHRFTAPVDGKYLITLSAYTNYSSSYGYYAIYKNGSNTQTMHWNHGGMNGHTMMGYTRLLSLSSGDYIDFRRPGAGGSYFNNTYATIYLAS